MISAVILMKRLSPSTRHIEYSKYARPASRAHRGGFTLIELLVVIAIAAILSALLLGGFVNMSASNKRLSCQVNLQTIYGALRMYAADNDGGYPYYNAASANGGTTSASTPEDTRFGLWALYTNDSLTNSNGSLPFPSNRVPDADNAVLTDNPLRPIGIYLRSSESLHCPADLNNAELYNADRTAFNPNYLSYQTPDNGAEIYSGSTLTVATYQSQRVTDSTNANWKRQLMFFDGTQRIFDQRAASNAVITWCKWHRKGLGSTQIDPILFADGSVRAKPLNKKPDPSPDQEPGWTRKND